MKNIKAFLPHTIAVLIFVVLAGLYFAPHFSGYELNQHDFQTVTGVTKEAKDFHKRDGDAPLWTNSVFSGMPTFQIYGSNYSNILYTINRTVFINTFGYPVGVLIIAMISFYILLLCFNVKPSLSVVGAVAFAFASVNILYLGNGHVTKVNAIALLPGIIASMYLAYRKSLYPGAALLAVFVCLHIAANHVQQTYYFLFLAALFVMVEFYNFYKEKQLKKFVKISLVLAIAAIIGVLPTLSNLLVTYDYGKYSTRGKSELTISAAEGVNKTEGLDQDYIKQYSMSYGEVLSVAVPNIKGGASGYIGNKPENLKKVSPEFKEYVANFNTYWGEQLGSGGAFYFGAIVFLLFVLAMFFIKDRIKWAFFAACILAVILSWKHSAILAWFIDHFPMFNKFRDTKMIMILCQISFPLLGFWFVNQLLQTEIDKKRLLYVLSGTIGVFVLFYIAPTLFFSFFSTQELAFFEKQIAAYASNANVVQQYTRFQGEIESVRIAIFKADMLRSVFLMLLAASLILLFVYKKLKANYFIAILGIIVLADLWTVDKRYINNEKKGGNYKFWVKKEVAKHPFAVSVADKFILQNETTNNPQIASLIENEAQKQNQLNAMQKEDLKFEVLNANSNYRVLTFADPFSDANVPYYHKSIGGYHGAKLKRYQEIIDFRLQPEMQVLSEALKTNDMSKIMLSLQQGIPTLNMLNTRYIIYNPAAAPIVNPYANGNAWFVTNIEMAETPDKEILALNTIDPKTTAVIEKSFAPLLPQQLTPDTSAKITLTKYHPAHLEYASSSATEQLAVFSEVYYPAGWNAYIDGQKVPYLKVNYVLRGLVIPAGEHKVEFKFEPTIYQTGKNMSYAGSVLLILFVAGMVVLEIRRRKT